MVPKGASLISERKLIRVGSVRSNRAGGDERGAFVVGVWCLHENTVEVLM